MSCGRNHVAEAQTQAAFALRGWQGQIRHGGHHVLDELRKVEEATNYDFDILLLISTV
jgi:hypothetical protein